MFFTGQTWIQKDGSFGENLTICTCVGWRRSGCSRRTSMSFMSPGAREARVWLTRWARHLVPNLKKRAVDIPGAGIYSWTPYFSRTTSGFSRQGRMCSPSRLRVCSLSAAPTRFSARRGWSGQAGLSTSGSRCTLNHQERNISIYLFPSIFHNASNSHAKHTAELYGSFFFVLPPFQLLVS
jgi:hypothetical protein